MKAARRAVVAIVLCLLPAMPSSLRQARRATHRTAARAGLADYALACRRTAAPAALALAALVPQSVLAYATTTNQPNNLGNLNDAAYGVVNGIDEDAPFRAAIGQIKSLLDTLGVEGAVAKPKKPSFDDGPLIERRYEVGLREGSDRLRECATKETCLSSTRGEGNNFKTPPFVFFDQKGDAVGNLLELLYSAADATVLTAKGNFFNGAGVYVLAELYDATPRGAATHDIEFQFLPGVLENVVEVRITAREGAAATSQQRQRELLAVFGKALGWLPLDARTPVLPGLTNEEKGIIETSALELKFREQYEGEMEKADRELRAQMAEEQKRIAELKVSIERLLDDISRQQDRRYEEYIQLRSRTAQARRDYEEGVNKRIGGVANDGRYAASQNIKLGNSFAGLINSQNDVTAKIYENAQGESEVPVKKKNIFGF
eukprot:CAMPEP_0119273792 /NCGR_PEP_ID=MMETSP1329-20130426/10956_1 /TAXON_ID=114041 /ORGANISM="Genus nov. species nov., Strain RCC1024" /LENGTH=431 /DNA_ID=CAMNT_0007274035 /DNA_START=102 /DNA_END=1394 /DNA_ORIENTATION=+